MQAKREFAIVGLITAVLALPLFAYAQTMSSGNYTIEFGRIEGGWVYASSASSESVAVVPSDTSTGTTDDGSSDSETNTNNVVPEMNTNTSNTNQANTNTNVAVVPDTVVNSNIHTPVVQPDDVDQNTNTVPTEAAEKSATTELSWYWYAVLGVLLIVVVAVIVSTVRMRR